MRSLLLLATLIASAAAADPDAVKAMEGGKPLPEGELSFSIPNMPKQSISFISNADEVIRGTVVFAGTEPVGTVKLDTKAGSGTGSISIAVAALTTGNAMRDSHLASEGWLNAAKNPTISYTDVKFTKVAPTVYELSGTWTTNGVAKPLTVLANVRLIPELYGLGKDLVRISTKFDLNLKDYGLTNPAIGSPVVAETWQIEINLLGTPPAAPK